MSSSHSAKTASFTGKKQKLSLSNLILAMMWKRREKKENPKKR
jgi:hypothetical protein